MAERDDLIERAQLLERAHALAGNGQPGVADIGTTDQPTPAASPGIIASAGRGVKNTLGAAAKALDVARGTTGGPLLGAALEQATGKHVFNAEDVVNAVNPTNLKKFPSSNEMFERAGIPAGAKVSDVLPSAYATPSPQNPWYLPEKGGALDFTVRGAGGLGADIATDPLTYLTFGGASAAKKAAGESFSKAALKAAQEGASPAEKILQMTAEHAPQGLEMSGLERAGQAVGQAPWYGKLTTPVTSLAKKWGKGLYDSTIMPVEQQGLKYGKSDVGETLYNAGIKSPLGLPQKASAAVGTLMDARNAVAGRAADQGAVVSMQRAMAPVSEEMAAARATGSPVRKDLADAVDPEIERWLEIEQGKPEMPATRGEDFRPIPAQPAVPGRVVTPVDSLGYTSDLYSQMPNTAYAETLKTPLGVQAQKAMASGMRQETLDAVRRASGEKAAQAVEELNAEAGKLIATRQGQNTAAAQANRLAHQAQSFTGTDSVGTGLAGSLGGSPEALKYLAAHHLGYLARLGTMPIGYGVRKFGESTLAGPLADAYARQKIIKTFGQPADQKQEK